MNRGLGGVEFATEAVPEWLAVLAAGLTQLGDSWFAGVLLVVVYWRYRSKAIDTMTVAGLWLLGVGLTGWIKETLMVARPNATPVAIDEFWWGLEIVLEHTATATGYGFPSGHAVTATVLYLGLASYLPVSTRRRRTIAAIGLLTMVSATRVVLGLHYLVDVIAGVGLGLAIHSLLPGLRSVQRVDRDVVLLGLAILASVGYVLASDGHLEALLAFGSTVGVTAGWHLVKADLSVRPSVSGALRNSGWGVRAGLGTLVAMVVVAPVALEVSLGGLAGLGAFAVVALGPVLWTRTSPPG